MPVALTASESRRLKKMAYGHKTPYQARERAAILLLAAWGELQRPDRLGDADARGHGANLARPVRRRRPACPGRPQTPGAATAVHPGAGKRKGLPTDPNHAAEWFHFAGPGVIRKYLNANPGYFPAPVTPCRAPPAGRSPAFRRGDLRDFDPNRTGDNTGTAGRPAGPQHRDRNPTEQRITPPSPNSATAPTRPPLLETSPKTGNDRVGSCAPGPGRARSVVP